jgi:hypothetical protein
VPLEFSNTGRCSLRHIGLGAFDELVSTILSGPSKNRLHTSPRYVPRFLAVENKTTVRKQTGATYAPHRGGSVILDGPASAIENWSEGLNRSGTDVDWPANESAIEKGLVW